MAPERSGQQPIPGLAAEFMECLYERGLRRPAIRLQRLLLRARVSAAAANRG